MNITSTNTHNTADSSLLSNQENLIQEVSSHKESGDFIGFSKEDLQLNELITTDPELLTKEIKETQTLQTVAIYPKTHAIYQTIQQLNNHPDDQFPLSCLIVLINKFSKEKSLVSANAFKPRTTADVLITGSEAWRILFKHPEIVLDLLQIAFKDEFSEKRYEIWKNELIHECASNQKYSGSETDYKLIFPGATSEQLREISTLAKQAYLDKFSLPPEGDQTITQFAIINPHMTLFGYRRTEIIGGKETEIHREFSFTNNQGIPLSNAHSLALLITDKGIEIQTFGFTLKAALMSWRTLGGLYIYCERNIQSIVRKNLYGTALPWGDNEYRTIARSLELFLQVPPFTQENRQDIYSNIMQQLGFNFNTAIIKYWKEGQLPSAQEELIARYIYFLIASKLQTKSEDYIELAAPFALRMCLSFHASQTLSDEAVKQILSWLRMDRLFLDEKTPLFVTLINEILCQKEKPIPISLLKNILTLFSWIYQPETYSNRQSHPEFCVKVPFAFQVSADLLQALPTVNKYLNEGGDVDVLKKIHTFFETSLNDKNFYYQKISQQLNMDIKDLETNCDLLFKHKDPFISFIGIQLKNCFKSSNALFFTQRFPEYFQLKCLKCEPKRLYEIFEQQFGKFDTSLIDLHSLSGWVHLLLLTQQPSMRYIAYDLWIKHFHLLDASVHLDMLKYASSTEPLKVITMFLRIYPILSIDETVCFNAFKNMQNSFPKGLSFSEYFYPLLKKVLIDTTKNYCQVNTQNEFGLFLSKILEETQEKEKKMTLLLHAIFRGYIKVIDLSDENKRLLNPLLSFFNYRETHSLLFSKFDEKLILSIFLSKKCPKIAKDWINLLNFIFYSIPSDSVSVNTLIELLQSINGQLGSSKQSLKGLHEIHKMMQIERNETRSTCLVEDPLANQLILETQKFIGPNKPFLNDIAIRISHFYFDKIPLDSLVAHLVTLLEHPLENSLFLEALFKRILSDFPQLAANKFDIHVIPDWIKLFAQTFNENLILVAKDLLEKYPEKNSTKSALIIFGALAYIKSEKTYQYFYDLHTHSSFELAADESLKCIQCIRKLSVPSQKETSQHLQNLYPLLLNILKKNRSCSSSQKIKFSDSLIFFIDQNLQPPLVQELLMSGLLDNFISLKHLQSKHFHIILEIVSKKLAIKKANTKNYQQLTIKCGTYLLQEANSDYHLFLNQLLQMDELSSYTLNSFAQFLSSSLFNSIPDAELNEDLLLTINKLYQLNTSDALEKAKIISLFFSKIFKLDASAIPRDLLNAIDELMVQHSSSLVTLNDWPHALCRYLQATEIPLGRPNLYLLFNLLIPYSSRLTTDVLLGVLGHLLHNHFPTDLPLSISNLIKNENPIDHFIDKQEWQTAQIYILFYHQRQFIFKDSLSKIWVVSKKIAQQTEIDANALVKLLQSKEISEWNHFFQAMSFSLEDLEALKNIFNHMVSQETEKSHEKLKTWGLLLIRHYFHHSPTKNLGDFFVCTDELYTLTLSVILKQKVSNTLKEALLLGRALRGEKIEKIIQAELEKVVINSSTQFSMCLQLIELYFPKHDRFLLSLLSALDTCKDDNEINRVVNLLENFTPPIQLEIAKCWLKILPRLLTRQNPGHLNKTSNSKEIQFSASDFNDKMFFIITHLDASIENFDIYFSLFNLMNSIFITSYPKECVRVVNKIYRYENRKQKYSKIALEKFHEKLRILKQHLLENFEMLVPWIQVETSEIINQTDYPENIQKHFNFEKLRIAHQICASYLTDENLFFFNQVATCLENKSPHLRAKDEAVDHQLAVQIFIYRFKLLYDPLIPIEDTTKFEIFFKNYLDILDQLNFENHVNEFVLECLIGLMRQINSNYTLAILESHKVAKKEAVLNEKCLLKLYDLCVDSLLPENFVNFNSTYFPTIFKLIYLVSEPIEVKNQMVEKIIIKVLEKIKLEKTRKDQTHFIKIKKLLENGFEFLISQVFYEVKDNVILYESTYSMLLKFKELRIHEPQEDWLYIHLNMMQSQDALLKELPSQRKHRIIFTVLEKFLSVNTLLTIQNACVLYARHVEFDSKIEEKLRLETFRKITSSIITHFPKNLVGNRTLLEFLNTVRYKQIHNEIYAKRFEKGGEFYEFITYISEIEFNLAKKCIKNFEKEESLDYRAISYYIVLALKIFYQRVDQNYISNQTEEYFSNLNEMLDYVIQATNWYLENKIAVSQEADFYSFLLPLQFFCTACLYRLNNRSGAIISRQYSILKQLTEQFVALDSVENMDAIQKNCENLLGILINIFNDPPLVNEKQMRELVDPIFDYLIKQNLAQINPILQICQVHYAHSFNEIDDEKFLSDFKKCGELLLEVPVDSPFRADLYNFVKHQVSGFPTFNEGIKKFSIASLDFLRLHLKYVEAFDPSVREKESFCIPTFIHYLLKHKIVKYDDFHLIKIFPIIQNWYVINRLNVTSLNPLMLLLQAPNTEESVVIEALRTVMIEFAFWLRKHEITTGLYHLEDLFNLYPHKKQNLQTDWAFLMDPAMTCQLNLNQNN